jgi:hypothetical protein
LIQPALICAPNDAVPVPSNNTEKRGLLLGSLKRTKVNKEQHHNKRKKKKEETDLENARIADIAKPSCLRLQQPKTRSADQKHAQQQLHRSPRTAQSIKRKKKKKNKKDTTQKDKEPVPFLAVEASLRPAKTLPPKCRA